MTVYTRTRFRHLVAVLLLTLAVTLAVAVHAQAYRSGEHRAAHYTLDCVTAGHAGHWCAHSNPERVVFRHCHAEDDYTRMGLVAYDPPQRMVVRCYEH